MAPLELKKKIAQYSHQRILDVKVITRGNELDNICSNPVYISLFTNAFWKGMNPSVLPLKIVELTGLISLGMVKKNSEFRLAVLCLKTNILLPSDYGGGVDYIHKHLKNGQKKWLIY